MAQIRDTIEALCSILNSNCRTKVSAECLRLAKFNKEEATESLWSTLFTVLYTGNLTKHIDKSNQSIVAFCKHKMFHKGYQLDEFFRLPDDMSRGSRELMLALGWLIAREDVVSSFINKLEPLVFEDPPMDLPLYDEIPLRPALDVFRGQTNKENGDKIIDLAECLILQYNKLNSSLKNLFGSMNEYSKIMSKLHSVPKTSKSQTSSHFSSQDVYFLRYPHELTKYQEKLEWFCSYAKDLVCWSSNELTFWKWMESVLDGKFSDNAEKETAQCDGHKHAPQFKPNKDLQIAKEHQVRLSQILNAQESTYRQVSKTWKKIKASLQSCEEGRANLADALSLLDSKLLSEIKELQKDLSNCREKCRDLRPKRVSVCIKKLTDRDACKAGRTSREPVSKSMASEKIMKLRQVRDTLEIKLRSLEETHNEKLLQLSQAREDLVCISPGMRGNVI